MSKKEGVLVIVETSAQGPALYSLGLHCGTELAWTIWTLVRAGICHESAQAQPVKDALWKSRVDQGRTALCGGYHGQPFCATRWRWICLLDRVSGEVGRECVY